ncbi:MAG: hypothetical protein JSS10_01490 [Verrucomicrobia bacterium]|nr:hypothetical protein [Verrucomicrobiota bacterium]
MTLKISIEFQGMDYIAEITPLVSGKPAPVKPEMLEAENIQLIYSRQLQAMARQYETSYQPDFGLLVSANIQGFQFEKGEVVHTHQVWKDFIHSLFHPEEELADEAGGRSAQVNFTDISLYKQAPKEKRSQILMNLYLKNLHELKGQKVEYNPIEKQCHACFLQKDFRPHPSLEDVKNQELQRAELYQKLVRKKRKGKISVENWSRLQKHMRAIYEEKAP